MAQYQDIFERYEQKFLLTGRELLSLTELLKEHMDVDQYGLHTICSLYFDTDSYQIIRTSLEKPVYKEKLRLRSYGIPQMNDTVFLELKKKYKGIVYKRRVALTLAEAERYLTRREHPEVAGQILNEIDWFLRLYHGPSAKVFIAYDRVALFGRDDPRLRITIDRNIRWRSWELDLAKGDHGEALLAPETYLMEIKIPNAIPLWLSGILTQLHFFPTSFSKYGFCYQEVLAKQNGGPICV